MDRIVSVPEFTYLLSMVSSKQKKIVGDGISILLLPN